MAVGLTLVILLLSTSVHCRLEKLLEPEEGSDNGRRGNGSSRAYYGGWSYCSSSSPCSAYRGDCDNDNECQVYILGEFNAEYTKYLHSTVKNQIKMGAPYSHPKGKTPQIHHLPITHYQSISRNQQN